MLVAWLITPGIRIVPGAIDNADDLRPALKRAVGQVKKGMPALVDAVTQHR